MNYYNEIDPFAAQWLRNLIAAELIPAGHVDERSIKEVQPDDLHGYTQCHFFAGIAGWSEALRLAGWPASREVWTGSCPCQPFSAAGKRKGTADERHLWPEFYRLIAKCKPAICFGEQVASKAGRAWLAGVRADLERVGYAVGAADLCAASVGAPHIRQRLWWVADANLSYEHEWASGGQQSVRDRLCEHRQGMAVAKGEGRRANAGAVRSRPSTRLRAPEGENERRASKQTGRAVDSGTDLRTEHAASDGREQWRAESNWWGLASRCGEDGIARRIEPGLIPLAHGIPRRMDKCRGFGNAIVPQVAAEFIQAYLDLPTRTAPAFAERQA